MGFFLYYWKRFYEDTRNEKLEIGKLNQNSPVMEIIQPGDGVIAFARNGDTYEVVALFPVDHVGENSMASHDREEYGRWFFQSNSSTYFSSSARQSCEHIIRNSELTANARSLGQSFQGKNAVRKLNDATAKRLLLNAGLKNV